MRERIIKEMELSGFIQNNKIKIEEIKKDDTVVLKAIITKTAMNPYGMAHGGFIFGLGDTAMGIRAALTGKKAVTTTANINYLKKATGNYLIAEAEIIKDGTSIAYLETKIYNDKNELIATMNSNYFYIK